MTVRANTIVRKTRNDKKDTICKRCGHECSTPQKLHTKDNEQRKKQDKGKNRRREKPKEVIPTSETSSRKEDTYKGKQFISQEEADRWVNPNAQKPGEHYKLWGARLHKRWVQDLGLGDCKRPENLNDCKLLCHDLDQYDPKAHRLSTKKELEEDEKWFGQEPQVPEADPEAGPGPVTQMHREKANNEKFRRLGEITDEQERDLEFREQDDLGTAVKRRAIAVHRAKVPRSHPDNGSDIQKMLESRRKQFKKILEKEFDKRGQFKFALCSLTKFLIDDKPGNDKPEKKNSRTDWLKNKQIIVNNRAEIDDYLSNAFEQILYQVEERGGKSNA
ncbi:hypothetical protein RhiirA1_393855 [Rhizophagus irregularis]|uniref:Uncharacterized protein n=1 Tax=Rhizophagus irregularis TaxID=588596 RepID=A0A2N0RVD0_9GLOM|nr:hypothetical protein RhiirA1_393855 [Rhizophagus irregularis]